ncbi:MAG: PIN domain nuclease [Armatimonadota bacterium]|nr:PIN domain nuclease [Armatimonadota bacterium]
MLLRFTELAHPFNPIARQAIRKIRRGGGVVWACPQNFTEFWAVATRPLSANGLGFTTAQAEIELANIETLFPLLPEGPAIYPEWRRLVTLAGVSGKPTHDVRLMAVAVTNGISNLLTFNGSDFTRFISLAPTVTILDPNQV